MIYLSRVDRDSTQAGREESWGSILVQSLDTTDMAECSVSLWIWAPESRMKARTQVRPPASNTEPASRVQTSSSTLMHCSARSREVLIGQKLE